MKLLLSMLFIAINLYADKNWIQIKSMNETAKPKGDIKRDFNLSQIEPINKLIKNTLVIKQLIESTKKVKQTTDKKKWFVLNSEVSK